MAKETIEQRQQRLLQSKLARQAREQEIIKGLPTLGAQAGWMAGLMLPSSGGTDYFGMYPQIPTEEKMMPTERLPSFSENIANKRYMDAMYQTLGVLGDAAYASAPFTGPAGLIGGTVLKGAGAIGKVSKASKAKGIASLQEKSDLAKAVKQKQKEAMERHANDYSDNVVAGSAGDLDYSSREIPFVSPTLEALIKKAPKNLKGKQVMEWVNANANKGVKPKEVEYLGIDEFIANNPNATVDQVIEGISENKISIQKSIYKSDDATSRLDFIESNPNTDPLDGSNFWQHRTDEILDDLERPVPDSRGMIKESDFVAQDRARQELLDHYNQEWRPKVNKKEWHEVPETMHEEIADSLAKQEYRNNPYEMIEVADDLGQAPNSTFALGNEDIGYNLFVDGKRIDTRDIPFSNTEAKIQLRQAMADEGYDYFRLEGEDDFGATQFKEYIDNNLPGGENYREVSFNWENAPKGHSHADHIEEDNQIAHALIRDRQLADGTDSLHIDELQSDLHKYGSRDGYKTKESIEELNKQSSYFKSKIEDAYEKLEPIIEKYRLTKRFKNEPRFTFHPPDEGGLQTQPQLLFDLDDYIDDTVREYTRREKIGPSQLPKDLNDALLKLQGPVDDFKDIFRIERKKVPNYPFKDDWYNMGIKSLLMDAVEDGKDAISISTSAAMKNRYSDQYHKFYETLYDKKIPSAMEKLAKKYGGEFEAKAKLDLDDIYKPQPGDVRLDPYGTGGEKFDANVIKITPEMREKILKEGLQTFASGGVIGNLPSRLAKI